MAKTPAWTRKEGKNPRGGLNEKGRKSYTQGTLKRPVKSGDNPRRASFLARMGNMRGPERDSKGKPTRLLLSLKAVKGIKHNGKENSKTNCCNKKSKSK